MSDPLVDLLESQVNQSREHLESVAAAYMTPPTTTAINTVSADPKIIEHCRKAAEIVATWPKWKQTILSNSLKPTNDYSRVPRRDMSNSLNSLSPEKKDTNPKDAIGSKKVPYHLLSGPVLGEVALGMLEGACKYGAHNYRRIGVRETVYLAAALRHIFDYQEGQNIDPDSRLHHLSKAMSCLHVIRDAQIRGLAVDERPPGTADFIRQLNEKAAEILARYPNPEEPYLANGEHPTADFGWK